MAQVFGFGNQLDDRFTILVLANIDVADVGVVVGEDGDQLLQHSGAVVAGDGEFDRVALRLAGLVGLSGAGPLDVDSAVALVEQVLHVGTAARVDGDTFAAGDVAD